MKNLKKIEEKFFKIYGEKREIREIGEIDLVSFPSRNDLRFMNEKELEKIFDLLDSGNIGYVEDFMKDREDDDSYMSYKSYLIDTVERLIEYTEADFYDENGNLWKIEEFLDDENLEKIFVSLYYGA